MNNSIISIFTNGTELSADVKTLLTKKLINRGYTVMSEYSREASLLICIGGDGAFLETIHKCDSRYTIVGKTRHRDLPEVLPEDF